MSRLKELIEELCPDGVEYKRFDEVCTLKARVGWQRLTKKEHLPSGEYMLVTGTDFTDAHTVNYATCVYVDKARYDMDENIQLRNGDVLITKDGTLGKVAYVNDLPMPATLNGGVFVVRATDDGIEQRYIMHFLLSKGFMTAVESQHTGSTIKHLTQAIFSRIRIPVPPIEVQLEIVRILDSMQELDDALSEEIALRKRQKTECSTKVYESLQRDKVPSVMLGSIAVRVSSGKTKNRGEDGEYLVYGSTGPIARCDSPEYEGNKILVARVGANCGHVHSAKGKYGVTDNTLMVTLKDTVSFDFVLQQMQGMNLNALAVGGGQPLITGAVLKRVEIVLPDFQKQVEIADKIKNMTDMLDVIEEELQARRKQFEYYRDQLLDFPEKEAVA